MQTIVYRFSLDVLKSGVQRLIEGLQTQDQLARKLEISLVSGSKTYEIPTNNIRADLHLTFPNGATAIKACEIDGNRIKYDITDADIALKGTITAQLKLIGIRAGAPEAVLVSPMFEMDVWQSAAGDVAPDDRFDALTQAIAKAESLGDSAIVSVEMDEDNKIIITQRDGTAYESTAFSDFYEIIDQRAKDAAASAEMAQKVVTDDVVKAAKIIEDTIDGIDDKLDVAQNIVEKAQASADLTQKTIRVVTQAEYDALTEEEKKNGAAYLIEDASVGHVVIDDNNPGSNTVYSSEKVANLTRYVAKYKPKRGTIQTTEKINADTLQGYSADDFLKVEDEIDADTFNGHTIDEFVMSGGSGEINAATLEGHRADYFATAQALSDLNEKVDHLPTTGGRINYRVKE